MSEMRSIEIDFDVHKRIELERTSFDEPPNLALRRLLKIDSSIPTTAPPANATGRPWAGKGVTLPHGTELQMEYNGKVYTGHIQNGRWNVEGQNFNSPSDAAGSVATTKNGGQTSLNGWNYWSAKRPRDSDWILIRDLRNKA